MLESIIRTNYFKNLEFRRLVKNVTNYTIFQFTNYFVPLISIPYIVRVIGAEKFGILSYAQAVIYYFSIFVDYGFDISATQKIAQSKGDLDKISETISTVWTIKFLIMLCISLILLTIISITDEGRENSRVYLLTFSMIPANILISLWFFIGLEKMQYLNYSNFISRIGYLLGVFIFIKNESQYWLIPMINSFSLFFGAIATLLIIFVQFKIKLKIPRLEIIWSYLKDGFHVFVSNIAINFYRNSNIIILGFFASKEIVGIYSAGEKIIKVVQSTFTPITQVFYPFISRKKLISPSSTLKYIRLLLTYLGIIALIISVILLCFSKYIGLLLLGSKFRASIPVIQISSIAILFSVLNYVLGIIFMQNYDLRKEFSYCVVGIGFINIIVCSTLCYYFQEIGAAFSFTFAEISLFLIINYFIYIRREKWNLAANLSS